MPDPSASDAGPMTPAVSAQSTPAQRWLARLSFALAGLAIVILVVFAELKSLAMFGVGVVAAVVSVAAAYFVLSRRGIVRWLSLGLLVLVPIAVIAIFALGGVLWVAIVSAGVWLLAGVTARQALTGDPEDWRMPEYPARPPARRPFLIMNPKSGGGPSRSPTTRPTASTRSRCASGSPTSWTRSSARTPTPSSC